jgi:hypothetical protein
MTTWQIYGHIHSLLDWITVGAHRGIGQVVRFGGSGPTFWAGKRWDWWLQNVFRWAHANRELVSLYDKSRLKFWTFLRRPITEQMSCFGTSLISRPIAFLGFEYCGDYIWECILIRTNSRVVFFLWQKFRYVWAWIETKPDWFATFESESKWIKPEALYSCWFTSLARSAR